MIEGLKLIIWRCEWESFLWCGPSGRLMLCPCRAALGVFSAVFSRLAVQCPWEFCSLWPIPTLIFVSLWSQINQSRVSQRGHFKTSWAGCWNLEKSRSTDGAQALHCFPWCLLTTPECFGSHPGGQRTLLRVMGHQKCSSPIRNH